MTIAERIRKRRIELDLSQEELANILGYKSRSRSSYRRHRNALQGLEKLLTER